MNTLRPHLDPQPRGPDGPDRPSNSTPLASDDDSRPWTHARDRRLARHLVPDRPFPLSVGRHLPGVDSALKARGDA